jgi:hypothetical protein
MMAMRLKILAVVAALAVGTSSAAMAQYAIPAPGYPSNPVSGAAVGEMNGAAEAGPVGAIVGGAIGTATGALAGTANALASPSPACAPGYRYYNGACYLAR